MPTEGAEVKLAVDDANRLVAKSYARAEGRGRSWFSSPRRRLRRQLNEALGKTPDNAMVVMESLIADCDLHAYNARSAGKWWGRTYYLLGLPAAVLATIAGAAALASAAGRIPAAIIALISAGLTTAATFLNSNHNKQHNNELSAAWKELADAARLAIIECAGIAEEKNRRAGDDFLIGRMIKLHERKSALLREDLSTLPKEAGDKKRES
jgi:hypothetical protein